MVDVVDACHFKIIGDVGHGHVEGHVPGRPFLVGEVAGIFNRSQFVVHVFDIAFGRVVEHEGLQADEEVFPVVGGAIGFESVLGHDDAVVDAAFRKGVDVVQCGRSGASANHLRQLSASLECICADFGE